MNHWDHWDNNRRHSCLYYLYNTKKYKIITLPKDVYFMDKIPVEIVPQVFLIVTVAAIIITYLSSLYPAKQGARMDPIAALRNE